MSAASIFAKTSPVPAPQGETRAPAPGAENDASAFAGMVDDAPAKPAPGSDSKSAADTRSTKTSAAAPKKGLLSTDAMMAAQRSASADETTPPAEAAAPATAKEDESSDDVSLKSATAKDAAVAKADETVTTPIPVHPAPVVPAPVPTSAAAALEQAMVQAAGAQGSDQPEDAATPSTAEDGTAPPVSTFEQAVANASAGASRSPSSPNAAAASQDVPPSATPPSTTSTQADAAATASSPPAPTPAAATPAAPAVSAEVAAPPATPAIAVAQPQTPAPAPPPVIVPTNASHISQATMDTTVQIAAQITKELKGRSTRFEMGLTPEGLGRVDISLDIDSGGQLTARLAFDNPLAATELRGKVDELRRELTDAGFTIAHDGLDFSERQPSSSNGGFDRQQGRAFASASRITADADLSQPAPAAWMSLSLTRSGVDMKV